MKNEGFTIVELLAVIAIIGLILAFSIPVITSSSSGATEKAFQTKISMIESAGFMWGQDNIRVIIEDVNSTTDENNNKTTEKTVSDLVSDGYLEYEDGNSISDPRGINENLNNCTIKISANVNTKKIVSSKIQYDNNCKEK